MSSQGDNKVSQLETPYVHKFSVDQQKRQVHIRRCRRIMLAFLVIFIILGIQIFQSKRTLAKVNGNIAQYQASLQSQRKTSRQLKQQIQQLHDPEYAQQVKERDLDLADLEERARQGGYLVYQGKKYTNYGVATAAVRLTNALLSDSRTVMPVSNYRAEYGTYLSYPAVVGRDGVVEQLQLDLTAEEQEKLATSAKYIKERLQAEEERAAQAE